MSDNYSKSPNSTKKHRLKDQDSNDVMRILPHRFPFLLVDRVEQIFASHSGVGIKAISLGDPWFQGHFPEKPIFPGVLILEAMAQVASIVYSVSNATSLRNSNIYFVGIDRARFRNPVLPGCLLEIHIVKTHERVHDGNLLWCCKGEAKVDGKIVAEGQVMAMLGMTKN